MCNTITDRSMRCLVHGVAILLLIASAGAAAQQRQKISFAAAGENTKYTHRYNLDAGEAGHTIGLFEIHRTYPGDATVINGLKLKESWARGYNDYRDRNGMSTNHITYVFDNGDKMFVTTRTMGQADSAGKRSTFSVGEVTGGTGKLVGIKGISRSTGSSQSQGGFNENSTELEYWFVK